MQAYLLARRSTFADYCDIHDGSVARNRRVARLLLVLNTGERVFVRGCRACFMEAARLAKSPAPRK